MKVSSTTAWAIALAIGSAQVVGCGGAEATPAESEQVMVQLYIMSLPDLAGSPGSFVRQFAGTAPSKKELARYKGYDLDVADPPVFSGETCTARVRFRRAGQDQEAGTADWTLVRVGDVWKLKSAPLP